ncbi:MAG: AAA family ATPase [Deltaproteobacteria bacterium]|nr:AAA family ATPase [Deltaproteobacteria bacterium]
MARAVPAAVEPYSADVDYISDALEVLRLRCRRVLAEREVAGLVPRDPIATMTGSEPDPEALSAAETQARARLAARLEATAEPPAALRLQASFQLDPFELDVLMLALAPAIDGSFNGLYGRLKGLGYRAHLDVDVALAVLAGDFRDRIGRREAFGPGGRLLRHNLLLVGRGGVDSGDDFLNLELRLPARLVALLMGIEGEDPALRAFSRVIEPTETLDQVVLPPAEKAAIVRLIGQHQGYRAALRDWGLEAAVAYGRGIVMLFSGPPGTGKTLTARAVANHLGRRLISVDASRLADQQRSWEANLDNLLREARLQDAVLFFDECEALFAGSQRGTGHLSALLAALEQFEGVVILATNAPQALDPALDRRILYRVDFETPSPSLREAIWQVHLPPALPLAADVDVPYLARRFEFTGGYIKNAVLLAASATASRVAEGSGPAEVRQADLLEGAWTQLRHRLNQYADRDVADLRLDDLILPEETKGQIREIIEAVAAQQIVFREWGFGKKFNKGRGLSALFDGDPGTGKTLAAEIIAAELGLGLYRVNVANVMSKYIGETEKNLSRVFGEARSAHAVLLFDEADSLFSKRVEVKQANDRFANMEVNTLLQLIERYDGLVMLTTNLKTSLDSALERRLSFKIAFPFPDAETRATIWRHLLPESAPLGDDLDYDLLGDCYELSGGSIKNAVLRAAYRAAATRQQISMALLDDAARRECQAAGKLYRVATRDDW